ncbi:MAG TPA: tetratricopeptide repeat protein [Pyrinomonadaceae bacterium]|jgi:tetratricopeptide (TPR) repeat protein|nr:tetratricopeptide repeat protein [Pyrinomonadaceae bacterium]
MKSLRILQLPIFLSVFFAAAVPAHGQMIRLTIQTCEGTSPHCISSRANRVTDGSSADPATFVARAYFNILNSDYKGAAANYDNAIRMAPADAALYSNRAEMYAKLGDSKRAEGDRALAMSLLNEQVEKDPLDAAGYLARGLNFGRAGDPQRELADYDRAIELGLNTTQIFYYRGVSLLKLREYERALNDLNRAAELGPKFAQIYKVRASLYHDLGDFGREEADMQKYSELLKR